MPRAGPRNSCHNACCAFRKQHRDRDAIWNLRETLRELLRIHRDGQSSWTQKHQALQRDLTQRPIEGAAGMAKKRELRELKQRIFNLQDQLTTLERQFAQDSAQLKPAEAKIVQIRA